MRLESAATPRSHDWVEYTNPTGQPDFHGVWGLVRRYDPSGGPVQESACCSRCARPRHRLILATESVGAPRERTEQHAEQRSAQSTGPRIGPWSPCRCSAAR